MIRPAPVDPTPDEALLQVQESITWLIRLGEFHRFHRGDAGGGLHLDRTTFLLLSLLSQGRTLTMSEVAAHLDIPPSTATRRVAPLVEEGLVDRQRHPTSHRTVVLAATDAGRERVAEVQRARVETLLETFRDWDHAEVAALAGTLDRLVRTLSVELTHDEDFSGRHL